MVASQGFVKPPFFNTSCVPALADDIVLICSVLNNNHRIDKMIIPLL